MDPHHCYYYMYDWVASSSEHDEEIATLHWTERQTDKTNVIKFIYSICNLMEFAKALQNGIFITH